MSTSPVASQLSGIVVENANGSTASKRAQVDDTVQEPHSKRQATSTRANSSGPSSASASSSSRAFAADSHLVSSSLHVTTPGSGSSASLVPSASSTSSPSVVAGLSLHPGVTAAAGDAVPAQELESGVASSTTDDDGTNTTTTSTTTASGDATASNGTSNNRLSNSSTSSSTSTLPTPSAAAAAAAAAASTTSIASTTTENVSSGGDDAVASDSLPSSSSSSTTATSIGGAPANPGEGSTCKESICDGTHCNDPITVETRPVEGTRDQSLAIVFWHGHPWVRASEVSKVVCNWRRTTLLDRLRQNPRRAHHVKSCVDRFVLSALRVRSARVNLLDANNLRTILTSAGFDIDDAIQVTQGTLFGKDIRILAYSGKQWVVANEAGLAIMGWPADYNTGLSKRLHHARGGHLMYRCSDMKVLVKLGISAPCVNLIAVDAIQTALSTLGITISDDGMKLVTRQGAEFEWADGQWVETGDPAETIPASPATSLAGGTGSVPSTPRGGVKKERKGSKVLAGSRPKVSSPKTPGSGVKTPIRKHGAGSRLMKGVDLEAAQRVAVEIGAGALISLASPAAGGESATKRKTSRSRLNGPDVSTPLTASSTFSSLDGMSTPTDASAASATTTTTTTTTTKTAVTSLGGSPDESSNLADGLSSEAQQVQAEFVVANETVELPTPSGPRRERMFVVHWKGQRWLRVLDVEASVLIWSGGRVRSSYDGVFVTPPGPHLNQVLAEAGAAVPDGAPPVALTEVEEAGHVVCRLLGSSQ